MIRLIPSRGVRGFGSLACCGAVLAVYCAMGHAQEVGQTPPQGTDGGSARASAGSNPPATALNSPSTVTKRQAHEADGAYAAGTKKLGHQDFDGAERDFQRAVQLNPNDGNYAAALTVTHERRANELMQRASKARLAGDDKTAETLLAEARSIDPQNMMVIEHSGPFMRRVVGAGGTPSNGPEMGADDQNWRIQAMVPASAIRVKPDGSAKSFDLRGSSSDVLRDVAQAYGIRVVVDESLEQKTLRFNLKNATYEQAMGIAMRMANAFAVPIDDSSILVAIDTADMRKNIEPESEETIYLPALTVEEINDLAQVVRTIFNVKEASIEPGLGKIAIRAPLDVIDPLNATFKDLIDNGGELMIEVKLYEIASTHSIDAGATIPNQFTVFNVDQAANSIVNANQTLVQQAVAQGYVPAGASNLEIALALIQLGLVQSDLATNLLGVFGGGLLKTGVSGSGTIALNLGLNSSDTRTLDDVQLRVGDHQDAIFREGEKYPIVQSTYSTGSTSSLPAAVGNATINGVSVNSLLSQFTGGAGTTIPIVTYEDLGITLKAKPQLQKSGRINMQLDLKIEALSGSSLSGNPILNSRQFATDLTVADGESALMVSDVNKNESDAITGLPGLGGLPGFQLPLNDTRNRDNSQLVVVVTPHIVRRRSNMIAGPKIAVHGPVEE